jgi:hypothetical protein
VAGAPVHHLNMAKKLHVKNAMHLKIGKKLYFVGDLSLAIRSTTLNGPTHLGNSLHVPGCANLKLIIERRTFCRTASSTSLRL